LILIFGNKFRKGMTLRLRAGEGAAGEERWSQSRELNGGDELIIGSDDGDDWTL